MILRVVRPVGSISRLVGVEGAYRALGENLWCHAILPSPMPFKPLILFKGKLRTCLERIAETNYVKLCIMWYSKLRKLLGGCSPPSHRPSYWPGCWMLWMLMKGKSFFLNETKICSIGVISCSKTFFNTIYNLQMNKSSMLKICHSSTLFVHSNALGFNVNIYFRLLLVAFLAFPQPQINQMDAWFVFLQFPFLLNQI